MVKETKFYDLLQIPPNADPHEIKKAYRACALKYHPDKVRNVNDETTRRKRTELFQEMTRAYEVLSDDQKRAIYDRYGEEAVNQGVVAQDNGNFQGMASPAESLFSNFFGGSSGMHGGGRSFFDDAFNAFQSFDRDFDSPFGSAKFGSFGQNFFSHHHNSPEKGRDIYHTIYCTLMDFYNGKKIKLSLLRKVQCSKCHGTGGLRRVTCSRCNGAGIQVVERRMGGVYQRSSSTCQQCGGSGEYIPEDSICPECEGRRLVDKKVILEVTVPRGCGPGYQIVFAKGADEGINIIPGDVIVTLKERKKAHKNNYRMAGVKDNDEMDLNEKFARSNDDLLTTVKVPLRTAICGGDVSLKHLDGSVLHIYIDRGDLQHLSNVRVVKNRGMPISTNEPGTSSEVIGYGDLYVKFEVELPKPEDLTKKQYTALSMILAPKGQQHGDVEMVPNRETEDVSEKGNKCNGNDMIYSSPVDSKRIKALDIDFPEVQ